MQVVGTGPAPIGRLASAVAAASVLTAIAGTAFATAGGTAINTLTASKSILAPNSPARLLFNSRLRQVPIRLLALPTDVTNAGATTTSWFQTT